MPDLKDVFNVYQKYTNTSDKYKSSDFSGKMKDRFEDFSLQDYHSTLVPKNRKKFDSKSKYFFEEIEKDLIGLFLGCATPIHNKSAKNFPNETALNPFANGQNIGSKGLTDMEKYTNFYIKKIKEINEREYNVLKHHLSKISALVDFTKKLKDCFKRLIVAIFYMNNFNKTTFDRILNRLNGFIDELYVLGNINKNSNEENIYSFGDMDFHSVDTLTAARVGDIIYHTKHKDEINPFFNTEEYENPYIKDKKYINIYLHEGYTNLLSSSGPVSEDDITKNKDYRMYLKSIIHNMLSEYTDLLIKKVPDIKIDNYLKKNFGYDPAYNTIETLIFNEFIIEEAPKIIKSVSAELKTSIDGNDKLQVKLQNSSELNDAIKKYANDTYEKIEKILSEAEEDSKKLIAENPEFDEQLDKLLFKPFIKFHQADINKLKSKAEDNSHLFKD